MQQINAPIESFTVTGIDGTRLRAYRCGDGPHRWLLPPGLGTPLLSWKHLLEFFHPKMTIVTWEPRGCYDSERPASLDRLTVDDHVDDAMALVESVGWQDKSFVTGGWSMGIEIGLEIFDRRPDRVIALALINGAFERVLATAFAIPKADRILRSALFGMSALAGVFAPATRYLLGRDWTIEVLKSAGIVAANADFFGEVVREFRELDFKTYFRMIMKLDEHSARHILDKVDVPTLVTAGTGDKMTPLEISRQLHERITGSELFVVPSGTHYTTLEFPEIINLRLDHFFRNRVFPDTWDRC